MSEFDTQTGHSEKCLICGQWVPLNTFHGHYSQPPGVTNPQPTFQYSPTPYLPVLERIAAALEKINEKLEAIERFCDRHNRNMP